jgi:CrcB protein
VIVVLLSVAGGIGAATRFAVDGTIARRHRLPFPLGTLVINVTGSLLLGLLTGWMLHHPGAAVAEDLRTVLGVGFCGGYTTFSTASVETFRLWSADGPTRGAGYAVGTLLGSVAAAALGLWVGGLL